MNPKTTTERPRTTDEYIAKLANATPEETPISALGYNPDDRTGEQRLVDDFQEIEQLFSDIRDGEHDLLDPFARVLLAPYGIDAEVYSMASHHIQMNLWRFSPDERATIIAVLRMVLVAQDSEVWAAKREARIAAFKLKAEGRAEHEGETEDNADTTRAPEPAGAAG